MYDSKITTFILLATLVALFAFHIIKGKKLPKMGLLEKVKWENAKKTLTSLIFISASLLVLNWLCAQIGWRWWWVFWDHGPFWLSQTAIVFAILSLMVVNNGISQLFSTGIICIVIFGWIHVVREQRVESQTAKEIEDVTRLLQEQTEEIPVPKGRPYKVLRGDLRGLSNTTLLIRYNGEGEFKAQTPADFNKPGGVNKLDAYVRTIEVMSNDEDFLVVIRKRP